MENCGGLARARIEQASTWPGKAQNFMRHSMSKNQLTKYLLNKLILRPLALQQLTVNRGTNHLKKTKAFFKANGEIKIT